MLASTEGLLEQSYLDHGAGLVRHLTVVTRDRELAEDLAHDAFVRLAAEIDAGRLPDNPAAWLHRVGMNLAVSRARHRQVATRRHAELPRPSAPVGPDVVAEERELHGAVGVALAELSASERGALVLAAYGHGGAEIAAMLGRTPGATRTLLCRARAKVRQQLGFAGFAHA